MPRTGHLIIGSVCGALALSHPVWAQDVPARASANTSAIDQRRFDDLIALIEGPNSASARRTGARELLRQNWSETPRRLVTILTAPNNRPAKIAVAQALAELPEAFDPAYGPPLLALLADADAEVRQAASAALAASGGPRVVADVRTLALDPSRPHAARLAAIDTLGLMTHREAVAALAEALGAPDAEIRTAALSAMERATALTFQSDAAEALRWWDETRTLNLPDWQQLQIERLVRQSRLAGQRQAEVEQRLASTLRDSFFRAPESERPALLAGYLADPLPGVRLSGLDLVRSLLAEGKPVPPEAAARTRELLGATEPPVRAAAARVVAGFRDAADAPLLLGLLASSPGSDVAASVVNSLGFIGGPEVLPRLIELAGRRDPTISGEAVVALGRLAERGVLDAAAREQVVQVLLAKHRQNGRDAPATREQLLRAMNRTGDPRFGPAYLEGIDPAESAAVRQIAARGLAALLDNKTAASTQPAAPIGDQPTTQPGALSREALLAAVVASSSDADPAVRRPAVEALANAGHGEASLGALWARIGQGQEPDEPIRDAAWRGVLRLVASRPPDEIEGWLGRLPEGPLRERRAADLLAALEKAGAAAGEPRQKLGLIRARLAAQRVGLDQAGEALTAYRAALDDLRAARSAEAPRVALELLRLALRAGLLDARLASELSSQEHPLSPAAVWECAKAEAEPLLKAETAEKAAALLESLQRWPPTPLTEAMRQELEQWRTRARELCEKSADEPIRAALAALRENPADDAARVVLVNGGPRALAAVRGALRDAVSAETPEPAYEKQLYETLRALAPGWAGYDAGAAPADKLRALAGVEG